MAALAPMNVRALAAHDALIAGGVNAVTLSADPLLIAMRTEGERRAVVDELERVRAAGQDVDYDLLGGDQVAVAEPALTPAIGAGLRLRGQRCVSPGGYVSALAAAVRGRGGRVEEGGDGHGLHDRGDGVAVRVRDVAGRADSVRTDAVVIANGAWLSRLARRFGVRQPVQAGRGYSY
ncbi:NAD(P)/FAD-dependent oxidoreductase [Goodfellowiella coeruleoviolacea]|uniref:FAD dependent oxidoreductase n=1 Tax=Goodfellowiella coeruleoviolacea TaxID=334858 RepID=A0AAE3GNS5_9PSEU|nr:FAD-dependent oxidoreductase [Goodfellowiella coeruleoviolacea]MCP2169408.1 FAD dependent oxidoreductase [Goodfellowiella coeruleoviolacea]